ncbi:hypothetical protein [Guptibacillus algicola]|uniref:hypothetical protein n=1 Tax=Guptibacillus algicola TaxID=225844 RepID=UPI001CD271B8|nr:hypothetical protein [Alkalihalobacillus algicola]MCA0988225.1 hypothetical protein [Alkalihalobacillus algicola]
MKRKRHYVEEQLLREASNIREYRKLDVEVIPKKYPERSAPTKKNKTLVKTPV